MPGVFPGLRCAYPGYMTDPALLLEGFFMPGVFPGLRCAYPGYMTDPALLLEGFLCLAFSPDRGTCPGGGAMRLSWLHDVHMG